METSTGQRIKSERELNGWTQIVLAEKMGFLDPSYISKIEKGVRSVNPEELLRFADLFGCTVEYIMCKSDIRQIDKNQHVISKFGVSRLPILGTIQTGVPFPVQENYAGYLDVPEYIKGDFVFQVSGDGMAGAGILNGDYAICREAETAQNGQIVVVLRDLATGFAEASLKFYFDNGKGKTLRAANPKISDIKIKEGYRIAGVMEGLIRKESPEYHVYRDFLMVGGNEDWTEVIELASTAGINTNQVKEILAAQIEIAKRLKGN